MQIQPHLPVTHPSSQAARNRGEAGPEPTDGRAPSRAQHLGTYTHHPGLLAAMRPDEDPGVPVSVLEPVVREAMESRGLAMGFSAEAVEEVTRIGGPAPLEGPGVRDLRHLDWASIDNEDTKDIDQLAYVEDLGDGRKRLLVAIADVAESVEKAGAVDRDAFRNTTTVYTPGHVNPMLDKRLSTDWTSLNPDVDRRAMVTELIIAADGTVETSEVFEAAVHNRAKLDYNGVSDWLEHGGEVPAAIAGNPRMQRQLELQMEVGRMLGRAAAREGALAFETERVATVIKDGYVVDLVGEEKNLANEAVAHMMIATNIANAKFLHERGYPVFQRVVAPPGRWDRMREVAVEAASKLPDGREMPSEIAVLPEVADSEALARYLEEYKQRDPGGYSEVSLSFLKLMGGGDYVVTPPGEPLQGHFGQGVAGGDRGYVHSTAPNRRYPDIVIQRLLKAALAGEPSPYTVEELEAIAEQCNQQESAAKGAERQVRKAAVSHYLATKVGTEYNALVTGNTRKGVFVRVIDPPIEGKLVQGTEGADVGDQMRVELLAVNTDRGYIDFGRVLKNEAPSDPWLVSP